MLVPAGLVHIEGTGWWLGHDGAASAPTPRPIAGAAGPPRAGEEASFALVDLDAGPLDATTEADWDAVSSVLAGNELVLFDPRREAPWILAGLARRNLPGPRAVRSLAPAVRGRARIPRGSDLEGICRALGAPYREGESAHDAARNVAACLRIAEESRPAVAVPGSEALAGARVLTPAFLDSVPERPGVYRFFDNEGGLLYVGKAANLRRRLRAHAAAASAGRTPRKGTPALARLARVELEVSGSELQALLEEARAIRRERPRDNVQREVHERGRTYAPSRRVALIFESETRGVVIALFVDGGAFEAAVRLGPRGGGVLRAKAILSRLFRPGRRAARRSDPGSREGEVLRSWLARHGDSVTRVDLDSATGAAGALARVRAAAESVRRGEGGPALHR
ncbi:MAG: nucleotide excision repair endonuclease [Acidobacteria bacterium]|nr:nucleotide excision repair endonuclease [Acidobacteriota bacterium]